MLFVKKKKKTIIAERCLSNEGSLHENKNTANIIQLEDKMAHENVCFNM